MLIEAVCPSCLVERADWEGPGKHLDSCPNCGSFCPPVSTMHGQAEALRRQLRELGRSVLREFRRMMRVRR